MIKFNSLLREEGLDPALIKLARHQDRRFADRPSLDQLWRAGNGHFELYQRIQGRAKIFAGAKFLASFLATPLNETMFVGIFAINGRGRAPRGLIDPVTKQDVSGFDFYDLELTSRLADYRGRLIIEWGEGYRAWVQRAAVQDKPVIEIKRTISDPPFPGFMDFSVLLSELASVPLTWRNALAAVGGVYLLINPKTGKQYVGSASGPAGFWGRWENYVASGHGGNLRMKELPAADYQVSVIEVASSSTSIEELIVLESRWKNKFLTRKFGLNAN